MFIFETDIADMKREKHKYLLSTFLTTIVATLMGNQLRQKKQRVIEREREREREIIENKLGLRVNYTFTFRAQINGY